MDNREFLDSLTQRITQLLPRANELGEDARKRVRGLLQKSFDDLNLLTQEEFESRVRALERAEERITVLEQQVRELERRLEEQDQAQ